MDNQTIQKLKEALGKSTNIGIVVGEEPSLDAMAGALSLYLFLKNANKKVTIASPSDPIVEISSLVGIDRVQTNLGGDSGDLVVSFPYVEGEIEKVSYTLENGFLNIIVKAGEDGLSFSESDVKYSQGSGQIDLLVVVGTQKLSDLGDLFDSEKLRDTRIINIDTNEKNQKFGDIIIISPQFSSVSEQVADLALTLGLPIDQDTAQNLLNGITNATKNFQDPSTSPTAFEMASLLLKKGAMRPRTTMVSERTEPNEVSREARVERPHERTQVNQRVQAPASQPVQPRQQESTQQEDIRTKLQAEDTNKDQGEPEQGQDAAAPLDWLSPKVYKGSSNF